MLGLGSDMSKASVLGGPKPYVGTMDGINDFLRLSADGNEFRDYYRASWTLVFWQLHTDWPSTTHQLNGYSYGGDFGYVGIIAKNNFRTYMKVSQGGGGGSIFYQTRYYNDASDPWLDYPFPGESAPSSWHMYAVTCQANSGANSDMVLATGITKAGQDEDLVFETGSVWNETDHQASPTIYFDIGRYGGGYYQTGYLGKIGFWDVALDADQLNELYAGGDTSIIPDFRKNKGDYDASSKLQAYCNYENGVITNVGRDSDLTFVATGMGVTQTNHMGI